MAELQMGDGNVSHTIVVRIKAVAHLQFLSSDFSNPAI
jgi:hypothetical protein